MKLIPALRICTVGLLVAFGGCEEDNEVEALVDDYIAEVNEQVDTYCDCYQEWDYESRSACTNASDSIGPSQRRCIQDAFAADEEVARQYLECTVALEAEYTSCVHGRLSCTDAYSLDPCFEDYEIGRANCIELPVNVQRDLSLCFPE